MHGELALEDIFLSLAVSLLFGTLALFVAKRRGFFTFPDASSLGSSLGSSLYFYQLAAVVSCFLFIWFGTGVLFVSLISYAGFYTADQMQGWTMITSTLAAFLSVWLSSVLCGAAMRHSIWGTAFFQGKRRAVKDYLLGALTWGISYPIVSVVAELAALVAYCFSFFKPEDQVAVRTLKKAMADPWLFCVLLIMMTCVVPVVEEFLFRGCLQNWLRSLVGRSKAIVMTSLCFAGLHFSSSQGFGNVELLLSLFILSLFLGWLYERQNSLLAPIGLHSTFNAISALLIINVS